MDHDTVVAEIVELWDGVPLGLVREEQGSTEFRLHRGPDNVSAGFADDMGRYAIRGVGQFYCPTSFHRGMVALAKSLLRPGAADVLFRYRTVCADFESARGRWDTLVEQSLLVGYDPGELIRARGDLHEAETQRSQLITEIAVMCLVPRTGTQA